MTSWLDQLKATAEKAMQCNHLPYSAVVTNERLAFWKRWDEATALLVVEVLGHVATVLDEAHESTPGYCPLSDSFAALQKHVEGGGTDG